MMNLKEFQEHQKSFLGELLERCRRKQREYSDGENAFHNFEDATGIAMCNERETIAWELCVKHMQSVRDIVKHVEVEGHVDHHPTQELIDEKFGDIIVYMTLMHGMLTDRINFNKIIEE
jgi:hypothetical protein